MPLNIFQKFHNQWEYKWYDFQILLEGFYLILGMAWFNQVQLTLVIQSSMSVWTDKRSYLRCICGCIENRWPLCLPKRPNSGCGLLWRLCKHPSMLTQRRVYDRGSASHATDPSSLPLPDIQRKKQRAAGGKDREDRKNRKWLQGGRIAKNRSVSQKEERERKGRLEGSRYNLMKNMNRGMWKRRRGVVVSGKEKTTRRFITDTGNSSFKCWSYNKVKQLNSREFPQFWNKLLSQVSIYCKHLIGQTS